MSLSTLDWEHEMLALWMWGTIASTGAYPRCTHAGDKLCVRVCAPDVLSSRFQDLQSLLKGSEEGLAYLRASQAVACSFQAEIKRNRICWNVGC